MSIPSGGARPTNESRALGNRNLETLSCDYLNVSRSAAIKNLEVTTINQKTLKQFFSDFNKDEFLQMRNEIEILRKEIRELRKNSGPIGYMAGKAVTVMVHFEDIDLNSLHFDKNSFQNDIQLKMSEAARVSIEEVLILCVMENNGSTIVEFEILFQFSSDLIVQSAIIQNLSDFINSLNSGHINDLESQGDYSILKFGVGPIEGLACKISKIKSKFEKKEINFETSDALVIGDYKLVVKEAGLFVKRWDHYINEWVGGTLITD